jgi:hypothetical protein
MDEKGFLIGFTSCRLRVFSKAMYERKEFTETLRDGSREWISVIACICSDGTALDPGIIYQSDASTLQASWVADINPQDHSAFVTASKSGWSNNDIGLQWLIQVFDRLTKNKARLAWRLLFVDGHASHLSMDFLNYCDSHKILLAQFRSHATHTVQPLDVVMFKSLSHHYSQELDAYMLQGQGPLSMAKRDFFALFWNAWVTSFQEPLIFKAFETTGLWPQDANVILKRWDISNDPDSSDNPEGSDENDLSTWIKMERRLRGVVKDIHDPGTQQLARAIHHTIVQQDIVSHQNQGLEVAVKRRKQRQKPRKALQLEAIEEPGEYPGCAVWWSPRRIQRHRDRIEQERLDEEAEDRRKADKRST